MGQPDIGLIDAILEPQLSLNPKALNGTYIRFSRLF